MSNVPVDLLKEELDRKRKAIEPLKEALAASGSSSPALGAAGEKKKKVYMTNGQVRKLQAELSIGVGAASSNRSGGQEGDGSEHPDGPLSPDQIHKVVVEGKKLLPRAEVFKRLR